MVVSLLLADYFSTLKYWAFVVFYIIVLVVRRRNEFCKIRNMV